MAKPLSKRQVLYREYLKTDHWKELRARAMERDGGKCQCCAGVDRLQVHHKTYRARFEDSLMEDLETLCRKCHGLEHGYGLTSIEAAAQKIERHMMIQNTRPPKEWWFELKKEMIGYWDFEAPIFGGLMRTYIALVWPMEVEDREWWMTEQGKKWDRRARGVHHSICLRSEAYTRWTRERLENVR